MSATVGGPYGAGLFENGFDGDRARRINWHRRPGMHGAGELWHRLAEAPDPRPTKNASA